MRIAAGTEQLVVSLGNWLVSCKTSEKHCQYFIITNPKKMIRKEQLQFKEEYSN